ncbi:hypothetical protein SAMN02910456_02145 [Ruminococcaceae bacterium YRB3002]|nr:hypothetical protein SAMN02910456_02145 [Ruminococcaceae bacterium YRB3002]
MTAPVKKRPQRTCVVCRTKKDKADLVRIVATKDGEVRYDPTGRAPGRGAYLCKNEECLAAELRKSGRLAKGLRHEVTGDTLSELAQEILKKAIESAKTDDKKGN